MNKLLVPNGGMPLFGDDFAFLDTAARDALKGVLYELAKTYNGNLILGGCDFSATPTTITVTEGYVLINYEVCYFPGIVVSDTSGVGHISADNFFDPAGLKSFANGSSQNTYQIRRAKFTAGGIADGFLDFPNGHTRLSGSLYELLKNYVATSNSIICFNSWDKEIANQPQVNRHFRHVQLAGGFTVGAINGASFTKIALLPFTFRPMNRFKMICAAYGTGVFGNVMLEFFPNGEVFAISTDSNVYDLISVNTTFLAP